MALQQLGVAASGGADVCDTSDVKALIPWTAELHVREFGTRTTGTMDAPLGIVAPFALSLSECDLRYSTGDAAGSSSVYHIYKNGADFSPTAATITISGTGTTGSWTGSLTLAKGDVLTINCTQVGTTPGRALAALFIGTKT